MSKSVIFLFEIPLLLLFWWLKCVLLEICIIITHKSKIANRHVLFCCRNGIWHDGTNDTLWNLTLLKWLSFFANIRYNGNRKRVFLCLCYPWKKMTSHLYSIIYLHPPANKLLVLNIYTKRLSKVTLYKFRQFNNTTLHRPLLLLAPWRRQQLGILWIRLFCFTGLWLEHANSNCKFNEDNVVLILESWSPRNELPVTSHLARMKLRCNFSVNFGCPEKNIIMHSGPLCISRH